jgi:succinate dehydrogenase / fumarate reductase, membrane anchor subunit
MKASRHWRQQRYSAVALLPLSLVFLSSFATSLGQPLPQVLATWSSPVHALVAIAFFAVLFLHIQQGLTEVITDYMRGPARRATQLVVNAACLVLPLAAIAGIARTAFF